MQNDIIVALATAPAESAIGVIRLSGVGCFDLAARCLAGYKDPGQWRDREVLYSRFIHPGNSEALDEILLTPFRGPRSYSGEDMVEISGHGNPLLLREMLEGLLSLGARLAGPGEFTQRAYLNDKMDLTRAEAVNDLIRAHTRYARIQALGRLQGGLARRLDELTEQVLDALSLLEVAIDHSDEELDLEHRDRMDQRLAGIVSAMDSLLSTARSGRILSGGLRLALVGTPNTGKSSLMNALLREDRVIVTEIPGTTRDVVEDELNIQGIPVRIQDTAGIRQTVDLVEQQGVERSRRVLAEADLRLVLLDSSRNLSTEDRELLDMLPPQGNIYVLTKSDLPAVLRPTDLHELTGAEPLLLSSRSGDGLPGLEQAIRDFYFSLGHDPEQEVMLANLRQEELLVRARSSMEKALSALREGWSEEFVAADVRQARQSLEEITGHSNHEAVLDRIFSRFCIGK